MEIKTSTTVEALNVEIFSLVDNQEVIINHNNTFSIFMESNVITVDLLNHFYIRKIVFHVNNISLLNLHLDYYNLNGIKVNAEPEITPTETAISFIIENITSKLYLFYLDSHFDLDKASINKIELHGISFSQIEANIDKISKIESMEKELLQKIELVKAKQQKELSEHQSKITELNTKKTEIEASITTLSQQESQAKNSTTIAIDEQTKQETKLSNINESISVKLDEKNKLDSTLKTVSDEIVSSKAKSTELSNEIISRESKIRELIKKYSLYSNEYASYNRQGNKFISLYAALSIIPFALLCLFVFALFKGSVDLSVIYQKKENIDLMSIFTTRVPFVTISLAIISACFITLRILIIKVFDIQADKMALTKLSILAQDIVNTGAENLELSDAQIHEANIYLRMELIKSYMQGDIDRNFKYKIRDKALLSQVCKGLFADKIKEETAIPQSTKPPK